MNLNAPTRTDIAEGPPPTSMPNAATAFCPECNDAMAPNEPLCPHCGYDFPFGGEERGPGIAFSRFADIVLIIAAAITSLATIACILGAVMALVGGQPGSSLFLLFLGCILLAHTIVFLRVQRLESRSPAAIKRRRR